MLRKVCTHQLYKYHSVLEIYKHLFLPWHITKCNFNFLCYFQIIKTYLPNNVSIPAVVVGEIFNEIQGKQKICTFWFCCAYSRHACCFKLAIIKSHFCYKSAPGKEMYFVTWDTNFKELGDHQNAPVSKMLNFVPSVGLLNGWTEGMHNT